MFGLHAYFSKVEWRSEKECSFLICYSVVIRTLAKLYKQKQAQQDATNFEQGEMKDFLETIQLNDARNLESFKGNQIPVQLV